MVPSRVVTRPRRGVIGCLLAPRGTHRSLDAGERDDDGGRRVDSSGKRPRAAKQPPAAVLRRGLDRESTRPVEANGVLAGRGADRWCVHDFREGIDDRPAKAVPPPARRDRDRMQLDVAVAGARDPGARDDKAIHLPADERPFTGSRALRGALRRLRLVSGSEREKRCDALIVLAPAEIDQTHRSPFYHDPVPSLRMAALPPFQASIAPVTVQQLGRSWRPGCPVGPAALRRLRVSFVRFDGEAHTGELVVAARVVRDVRSVFRILYQARFPIRRMRPISVYEADDDRSAVADNTSAFNCRYAVASGPKRWSAHAYGEAIDVNDVENPYVLGARVIPPAGRRYLRRSPYRSGMAVPGGVLVRAFASVGWLWGGGWSGSPDWQHFSSNGR